MTKPLRNFILGLLCKQGEEPALGEGYEELSVICIELVVNRIGFCDIA